MAKITMKNCVFDGVSYTNAPAYIECGKCSKHSEIGANGEQLQCPHCGSTHMARLEMGRGKPSWFKKGEK